MHYIILGVSLLALLLLFLLLFRLSALNKSIGHDGSSQDILSELRASRMEASSTLQQSFQATANMLSEAQKSASLIQDQRLRELSDSLTARQATLQESVGQSLTRLESSLQHSGSQTEQKLENIRISLQRHLQALQEDNSKKLEEMRRTVDEKLQKTLEERLGQSFRLVSERLEQVSRGLGEMQTLAQSVGDLKTVLSGVKTRGILGEIQLGAILDEILSPEQYLTNVQVHPDSTARVEYAVKLPGQDDTPVLLPIDAKFPADAYHALTAAYESADNEQIRATGAALEKRIRLFAKEISQKYIAPPHTTDFAILFLPTEGLYCEVLRRGLSESLQRDYRISIAGPTTMAALLNSLQMGFKTLAIQKRSGEVWSLLGAVKTEFGKFSIILDSARKKLFQAGSDLDQLIGVRTRQIQRHLRDISALPEEESLSLLETENDPPSS
ncbi:MAG: DNA recombination protein RmuC [Christensenellales bacterium]|jgi:DNA recombination protein RmuC